MDIKKRSANFSEYEKCLLLEVIQKNEIICSKKKDSCTNANKETAWQTVLQTFNSDDKVVKRDQASLKALHLNLINKAKKESAERKRSIFKTGGGPEDAPKLSETSEIVASCMPTTFNSLDVPDCDAFDNGR